MPNEEFEPIKIKKSKLYLEATYENVIKNYHIKLGFFKRLKWILKRFIKN